MVFNQKLTGQTVSWAMVIFMLAGCGASGLVNTPTPSIEQALAATQSALEYQATLEVAAIATADAQWVATRSAQVTSEAATQSAQATSGAATQSAQATSGAVARATAFALLPELAINGVTTNAEWQSAYPDGFVQEFEGVPMVLVPAGCFEMGNDPQAQYWNGSQWITGVPSGGEQCFNPFWIDQTEVTQGDFTRLGGVQADPPDFSGTERPVEDITWFEARDFCEQRAMRLPTEAEWEYAARGVDELAYPWGNEFVADNVVYSSNSNNQTANVGSRPAGASWVGALDLSGNVWEWVSSLYKDYPYSETSEDISNRTDVRVLRGGSWLLTTDDLRAADRNGNQPLDRYNRGGFRCARS